MSIIPDFEIILYIIRIQNGGLSQFLGLSRGEDIRPGGYKTFFMLNSTEHEFFLLINVKMPTIAGILTFMSGKNSILGLSEPKMSQIS